MDGARILKGSVSLALLDKTFTNAALNTTSASEVPVLIALDTESSHRGKLSELGISLFDPMDILHESSDTESLNNKIITYYYAKGGSRDRHNYKPYRLGIPQPRLRNEDVQGILERHLRPKSSDETPRRILLIGHHIASDLHTLEDNHGIDLSRLSTVQAILDTQAIARLILNPAKPLGLRKLLQTLNLDYIGLHNAGHDSRYTLRAALMLFAMYKRHQYTEHEDQNRKMRRMNQLIENVARCHKTNERRKWTTPVRTKAPPVPDIFLQDAGDVQDGGIMALLL